MPLYNKPSSLESLAQKAIVDYVSNLGVHLIRLANLGQSAREFYLPCKSTIQLIDIMIICLKLQQMLHNNIPHSIASDITYEILKWLDDHYTEINPFICNTSGQIVLQRFISSILHSKVTKLEFSWRWKYIVHYVICEMQFLSKLKVLKLYDKAQNNDTDIHKCWWDSFTSMTEMQNGSNTVRRLRTRHKCANKCTEIKLLHDLLVDEIKGCAKYLVELEHLTLHFKCTDELLNDLGRTCTKIKTLNIRGSRKVTDRSVKVISEFKQLVALDVSHTNISCSGRTEMLRRMYQNRSSLKCYASSSISDTELHVLVNHFPDLIELAGRIGKSEETLISFPKLKVYKTSNYFYLCQKELLQFVGQHLLQLELIGYMVNVSDLVNNCPVLKSLTLKAERLEQGDTEIPNFTSLQNLTLVSEHSDGVSLLLSRCVNLKKLQLVANDRFYNNSLEEVLAANRLVCLETVALGSGAESKALRLITDTCKSLTTCKMLMNETDFRDLCQFYPGVQVDSQLFDELTNLGH